MGECRILRSFASLRMTGGEPILTVESIATRYAFTVIYPRQSSLWRSDGTFKQFFVYILSNSSMTLYTGITNDLTRRASEHRTGIGSGFTNRYHFDRVVYFETYDLVIDAIAREKSIKGMTRAKKIALIKSINPTWRDLLPPSS